MLGPFAKCEPPLHCQLPGVASRTPSIAIAQAACDVHIDDNDNAWQRGPLWPHGVGPMRILSSSVNGMFTNNLWSHKCVVFAFVISQQI